MGKFDFRVHEGIFLDYFFNSRGYLVYNLDTKTDAETINILINNKGCSRYNSVDEEKKFRYIKHDMITMQIIPLFNAPFSQANCITYVTSHPTSI